MSIIHVNYEVASTSYKIGQILKKLESYTLISFDVETQSVYSKEERTKAAKLVEQWKKDKVAEAKYSREEQKLIRQIGKSSGLSYPTLVKVTHFIFGVSEDLSYIIISYNQQTEQRIWKWLADYQGHTIVHNSLFDFKIMYQRIGKLPQSYDDTQIMARVQTNDADEFEGKVGLKELMGSYYDPKWTLLDEDGYDVVDYKNEAFLRYCAIDGAATFKLYQLLTGADDE